VGHRAIPSPTRRDSSRREAGHEDAPGCGVRTRLGRLLDPPVPVKKERMRGYCAAIRVMAAPTSSRGAEVGTGTCT